VRLDNDAVDLALARNHAAPVSGRSLSALVTRAKWVPALAEALLARPDLPATDRAALYLSAPLAERDAIRQGIESSPSALRATPLPRAGREAGEALALGLVAAGIGEEESVRIFLTLDDGIARSVATVFRLADIVRTTPRSSAIRLLEAILDAPLELRRHGRHQPAHAPGTRPRAPQPGVQRERPDAGALRAASGRGD
jgi:hypothetical protein